MSAAPGKTTIGTVLAARLGAAFADADDYHSAANKAKMAAGIPLTDADRAPWLATLNGVVRGWVAQGTHGVLACSALKESYRDTLRGRHGAWARSRLCGWDGSHELIASRLAARHHEYMTGALLDSQLATLEPPKNAIRVVNNCTPDQVVDEVLAKVGKIGSSS